MSPSNSPRAGPAPLALALIKATRNPVLLLDDKLAIVSASESFCSTFGYEPDDVERAGLATLGGGEWDVAQLRNLLNMTFAGSATVDAYEFDLVRPGREAACLVLNAHRLPGQDDAPLVLLTITDVTSARLADRIKDDLVKEKDLLLMELDHRVANSLQIIASVLMQSARRVQSEETRSHLRNAHHRVLSIATLQKQLAISSASEVKLRRYFQSLCESIGASMIDGEGHITLHANTDGSSVSANVATSLGLIVTELVINALKHAFPDPDRAGDIAVDYRAHGTGFALTVTDNGVGIAASEAPTAPGLGTSIVDALARHLGGTVETTDTAPGTRVSIVRAA